MDLAVRPSSAGRTDQTIIPSTRGGGTALQLWARRAGVGGEVESLQTVLGEVESVLAAAQRVETKNEPLEHALKELEYQFWDAEKLLDELDYHRIEDQLQATGMIRGDADGQLVSGITNQMSNLLISTNGEDPGISTSDVDELLPYNSTADASGSSFTSRQLVIYSGNPKTNLMASAENTLAPSVKISNSDVSRRMAKHIQQLSEMQKDVHKALKLEEKLGSISLEMCGTLANPRETASYSTENNVYGREQERDQIIDKLTNGGPDNGSLSVLAVVGNGGVGKTTLARVVYNDPRLESFFHLRMWICVSINFDEVKLTRELLECLYEDRYEGVKDLNELQQILEDGVKSRRLLLVMDDIWEDQDKNRWDTFLAPLLRSQVKGNKILVTTRKLSFASMIGLADQITLGGLEDDDFWSLFKECAFGDSRHEGYPKLQKIGRKIVKQLKGYPLAAKTVGKLLRRKLDVEHWQRILGSGEWKYQQGDHDIMPALKISYNYLPFHLQRCFSYCALFPKNYRFNSEQLVNMWIAQDFICSSNGNRRIEDIGSEYFHVLVEQGFFLTEPSRATYLMHDLIHDLAQMVSSHECFTIDGVVSRGAPQLMRHISVITEPAYRLKLDGSILPNECFQRKFLDVSCTFQTQNFDTLMLIGAYDSSFADTFRNGLNKVKSVTVLKLEMMFYNLDSLICNLSAFIHLRYLELGAVHAGSRLQLPEELCKLYHLEVLDIKHNWGVDTVLPRGINNLIYLRHFIAAEELHEKIAGVGKLIFLQELKAFRVRKESEFQIGQLRGLSKLSGSLGIYSLGHVETTDEAVEARLKEKMHIRDLKLSWDRTQRNGITHSLVLEGLEPNQRLRSLQIDGHRGTAPTWLVSNLSLTCLQSLHLESCHKWKDLPPLEKLPFLKELHLIRMLNVEQVLIGPLEVLELREMSKLARCIMLDDDQLSANLRTLEIVDCRHLRELPFLQCWDDVQIEQRFPLLHRLQICELPKSTALPPLPFTNTSTEIEVRSAGSTPDMMFTLRRARFGVLRLEIMGGIFLETLDETVLAFHNLSALQELEIKLSPNLTYLAWEGFQQLKVLKKLKILSCPKLFSSFPTVDEQDGTKYILPPSLEELELTLCNVTGKQLSQLMLGLPSLRSLKIGYCNLIDALSVTGLAAEDNTMAEGLWHIPSCRLMPLEKLEISFKQGAATTSSNMIFLSSKGLREFVSLKELVIEGCPELLSSMVSRAASDECSILPPSLLKLRITDLPDMMLRRSKLSNVVELDLSDSRSLITLDLRSCIALRKLSIEECSVLASVEGLQSLASLTALTVRHCPTLTSLQLHSCRKLQYLSTECCDVLSSLDGVHSLTSLTELKIQACPCLTSLLLHSCTALEKLNVENCEGLASWEGLRSLTHLKHLEVSKSPGFTSSWNLEAEEVHKAGSQFSLRLEYLCIDDIGILSIPICKMLTSLQILKICGAKPYIGPAFYVESFTEEQEKALQLLKSLRELSFSDLPRLQSLPAELYCLSSLEELCIHSCPDIRVLPERGLPTSLKKLDVKRCNHELNEQCSARAGAEHCNTYINGWEA